MLVGASSAREQVAVPQAGKSDAVTNVPASPVTESTPATAEPFISPAINYDYQSGITVLMYRNSETGKVTAQYPSQKVVEEYRRHGASTQDAGTVQSGGGASVKTPSAPVPDTGGQAVQATPAATGGVTPSGPSDT